MDLLILGLKTIASPQVLLWICLGVVMGVIFGALPGVSATMAIVLSSISTITMPLTFIKSRLIPCLTVFSTSLYLQRICENLDGN